MNRTYTMNRRLEVFVHSHPLFFSILFFLLSNICLWLICDAVFHALHLESSFGIGLKNSLSAALCILFYRVLMRKSPVQFKNNSYFRNLFTVGLMGLLGSVGALLFSFQVPNMTPSFLQIVTCVFMNLAIAVNEELLFRGVIFNELLNKWTNRKNGLICAILFSSLLFGIKHYTNLMYYPNQIISTNAQVIFTAMAGVYLAVIYFCSGNIWICITIHFLEDMSVTIWELFSSEAAAAAAADIQPAQALLMLLVQVPYLIFAVLIFRYYRKSSFKMRL